MSDSNLKTIIRANELCKQSEEEKSSEGNDKFDVKGNSSIQYSNSMEEKEEITGGEKIQKINIDKLF